MSKKSPFSFPKNFLWGAATAAHQVEGNTRNQWSQWELENAKSLANRSEYQFDYLDNWEKVKAQAKIPDNYVSGALADHYTHYELDFDILKKLNCNSYRFSIEWSRIEPEEGVWNAEAIQHYKEYIMALKKRGIEPMVTLFHFTLPIWFSNMGGFEKRKNVQYFVRFSQKILEELSPHVRYVITINEPQIYALNSYQEGNWPPAIQSRKAYLKVLWNLMLAHNQAAKAIHAINRRHTVALAHNSAYFYPGDDAWLSRLSAWVMQYAADDIVLRRTAKQSDFIGINYYFSNRVYGYRVHNPDEKLSDLGWDMSPANLEYAIERVYKKYKKPIIITENGLADADDSNRSWWLSETFSAMQRALEEGVDLRGYFHWSLLDNFEWDKGKWPRFGLVEIDYVTKKRKIRKSAKQLANVLKSVQKENS